MKFGYKKKYLSFLKFKNDFQKYGLEKARSYEMILHWLKSRLTRNQFLMLSGILVGCSAGLAGVVLKTIVHHIHYFITHKVYFGYQIMFYVVFPFLGIIITVLVVMTFFRGKERKGTSAILYDIAQNSSIVESVKMYSQMVQSAITVGLGGSVGLESPIAVTGSAIGSNYAQTYRLTYKERTLLLAAGAAAGISSAFNAPITGVMFAFEVLLTGVVFTDFIPLVVASVCGSLLSRILLQEDVLFRFYTRDAFDYHNTPYYIILGVCTGFYARYFIVVLKKVEIYMEKIKVSKIKKAMIGGSVLSLLCVLFPPLYGEGYDTIKAFTMGKTHFVIQNSFFKYFDVNELIIIVFVLFIVLLKAFATAFTLAGGGNGGNFAPSLFSGGTLGYLFAIVCQQIGFENVPVTNLVLVGMAGAMSGVLYAPLTAIFLIAESSLGYDLFIPLMVVSVISFLIVKRFSPISPELKSLAEDGKIFTSKHDENILYQLKTIDFIDTNSDCINENSSLKDLFEHIKTSHKNIFSIVDGSKELRGVLTLDDIRPFLFDESEENENRKITKIMKAPIAVIDPNDNLVDILQLFDNTGTWYLPAVDKNNVFLGFISKSSILMSYRDMLKDYS